MTKYCLVTGQTACYDSNGAAIPCFGSGQDGETRFGIVWPQPRFHQIGHQLVLDRLTNLIWLKNACYFSFPMTWQESLDAVKELNSKKGFGRDDWRLPNRRELRSLICHGSRNPALPAGHPFTNVFLGWYWTSTTSAMATAYSWYVQMDGGRMFYGKKDSAYMVWPVAGSSTLLPQTGQKQCYDQQGKIVDCMITGQDGEFCLGRAWPRPRFLFKENGVLDLLTGLLWHSNPSLTKEPVCWNEALSRVAEMARQTGLPWRLPNINELESLVDCSCHSPALPANNPFGNVQEAYWSSTTSFYEPDWSYVLYLHKGAVGVGYKKNMDFSFWPVLDDGFASASATTGEPIEHATDSIHPVF